MLKFHRESILSYFLGFVVIWFGINEVSHPDSWTIFIPDFLDSLGSAVALVKIHGVVLIALGIALVFDIKRRIAGGILAFMLASIVVTLLGSEGLSEIAVRDIGLLGMAIAIAIRD